MAKTDKLTRAKQILDANRVPMEYPLHCWYMGVIYRIDGPDAEPVVVNEIEGDQP
jgi:hypothetical protein